MQWRHRESYRILNGIKSYPRGHVSADFFRGLSESVSSFLAGGCRASGGMLRIAIPDTGRYDFGINIAWKGDNE